MLRMILVLIAFSFSVHAEARNWQRIEIPGAFCADGSNYAVFMSKKSTSQFTIKLAGGGACWSYATCLGWIPFTATRVDEDLNPDKDYLLSDLPERSPVSESSLLLLPYCTGDVHLGEHDTAYNGGPVHHMGGENVYLSLMYLDSKGLLPRQNIENLVVYGYSAGAIGSLVHLNLLTAYYGNVPKRTMILDAPGLHFGSKFWNKFPDDMRSDFGQALANMGMVRQDGNGNLTEAVSKACQKYPGWNFAFIQAQKDLVMSALFGAESPWEHRSNVLGADGILEKTKKLNDNCATFAPNAFNHSNLKHPKTVYNTAISDIDPNKKITALEFARNAVNGKQQENFH